MSTKNSYAMLCLWHKYGLKIIAMSFKYINNLKKEANLKNYGFFC